MYSGYSRPRAEEILSSAINKFASVLRDIYGHPKTLQFEAAYVDELMGYYQSIADQVSEGNEENIRSKLEGMNRAKKASFEVRSKCIAEFCETVLLCFNQDLDQLLGPKQDEQRVIEELDEVFIRTFRRKYASAMPPSLNSILTEAFKPNGDPGIRDMTNDLGRAPITPQEILYVLKVPSVVRTGRSARELTPEEADALVTKIREKIEREISAVCF